MQEGVGRRNIEDWVQDGVRRVRSTSLGELKSNSTSSTTSNTSLGELKSSSSSETFSAARRLVLDSVLGRVSNSQAAVVRRKAVHQLTTLGDPGPFLALVGISLASGSGIITKEHEIEQLCWEMRQAVARTRLLGQGSAEKDGGGEGKKKCWNIEDFELDQPIAKGCAAVVYSARVKEDQCDDAKGFNNSENITDEQKHQSSNKYPLAIKMMFNYNAESNASTILRAMHRETVPARYLSLPTDEDDLSRMLEEDVVRLKAHPNIVEMVAVFCAPVPALEGAMALYGSALPPRLNPQGLGRNMSLFLVMRSYDCSLADYLANHKPGPRTSLVLFTQLLEGVAFLTSSGVAHRDLKADNLLLSLSGGPEFPQLVITDFGCCIANKRLGLSLPFASLDTDRGGNTALMAPEVVKARPGPWVSINYARSDLWTAGAIGYQIFGAENPFTVGGLSSRSYTCSQLPRLPPTAPALLPPLLRWILAPAPSRRPSPRLAVTVSQLLLWAPSDWSSGRQVPSTQDILQWLLTMTTKVVCESRWGNSAGAAFEYTLVATFLATLSLKDIREALSWMQGQAAQENQTAG